jgi:hypothetical protein
MQTIAPLWLYTFIAIVLASLFIDFVVLENRARNDIGKSKKR